MSAPQGRRAFSPEQQQRIREALRAEVERYGSQTSASDAIGVSQQWINYVLGGGAPGYTNSKILAKHLKQTLDELADVKGEENTQLGAHPDWPTAAAELKRLEPERAEMIDRLATVRWAEPIEEMSAEIISDLLDVWLKAKRRAAARQKPSN